MIWHKCDDEYGDYLITWVTHDVIICDDLPATSVIVAVMDTDEDGYYWSDSYLRAYDDDEEYPNNDCYLKGVHINANLDYDKDDPVWLVRELRRWFSDVLHAKPQWFVDWYRESLEECQREELYQLKRMRR